MLVEADPNRHFFALPEWNRAWWEEFGANKRLFVLSFLDPEPVGLAALVLDLTDRGVRVRFLGGDDLTDYLGPLALSDEYLQPIADSIVSFMLDELPGWIYFEAKCLPVPFGFAERLVESADRQGLSFQLEQHEVTAVLRLPSSFDEYLTQLSPRRRHELRRKLRRFNESFPDHAVTTATQETLMGDVLSFVDMHRGSEGLKGKFMAPERATFFARVAQAFQPKGLLSLDFLESAGERLAAAFSFRYDGAFYLYNSAYETSAKEVSPGLALAAFLIQRSIEEGLVRFDFLRGPERYKFDLGAQPVPLHSVELTPGTPR